MAFPTKIFVCCSVKVELQHFALALIKGNFCGMAENRYISLIHAEATEKRLELTLGELVKTLVTTCKIGTLCTTMPLREDVDGIHRCVEGQSCSPVLACFAHLTLTFPSIDLGLNPTKLFPSGRRTEESILSVRQQMLLAA
jgi:hypothetical protein